MLVSSRDSGRKSSVTTGSGRSEQLRGSSSANWTPQTSTDCLSYPVVAMQGDRPMVNKNLLSAFTNIMWREFTVLKKNDGLLISLYQVTVATPNQKFCLEKSPLVDFKWLKHNSTAYHIIYKAQGGHVNMIFSGRGL